MTPRTILIGQIKTQPLTTNSKNGGLYINLLIEVTNSYTDNKTGVIMNQKYIFPVLVFGDSVYRVEKMKAGQYVAVEATLSSRERQGNNGVFRDLSLTLSKITEIGERGLTKPDFEGDLDLPLMSAGNEIPF